MQKETRNIMAQTKRFFDRLDKNAEPFKYFDEIGDRILGFPAG